ncbi:cytochrome d ubiquinol oxidase subunit II [Thermosulfurimonas marina]|uniref:Cytochrome d ubiquinol oxidase subunit II n=1 Tax=Thermosulfurimonas marina TaxID=2047767 RepID=A0A6H1WRM0_9BACT|nr:cytochrome d ubiquinol oxidase subunit II [Thermosulfurimonas marina]QJA05810.1 cytochrome d ubiquinol oxidase subunit II [Thermosulfurimonas marina]
MEHNVFQVIWFVLWGVLWAVYFVLDGFDLGAGILLPCVTKNEAERRAVYQAIGPFWDGNEVWLITAGGATFAAFPKTYAVMFSGLYTALFVLLFALIVRGVAIEFREKVAGEGWRRFWDFLFWISSLVATLILGVAFGNLFLGLPIDAQGIFRGSFLTLLHPYALLVGALFVVAISVHGACWLAFRVNGEFRERLLRDAKILWVFEAVLAVAVLLFSLKLTPLWGNYLKAPVLFVFPLLAVVGLILVPYFLNAGRTLAAFLSSGAAILGVTAWGVAGLFPNLFPSRLNPEWSLTIYNSSSSPLTLKIMTVVAVVFVPIVLLYTLWTYRTFSYRITREELAYGEGY